MATTYTTNWGSFALEGVWGDETVHVFRRGSGHGEAESIVIHQDPERPDRTASEYAEAQLQELKERLPKFLLTNSDASFVGGRPAHVYKFNWCSPDATFVQVQACVPMGGTTLVVTATGTPKLSHATMEAFEALLSTIRINRGR